MVKVAVNRQYGGFSISDKALHRYAELKGWTLYEKKSDYSDIFKTYYRTPDFQDNTYVSCCDISRDDPHLIQVLEEMGKEAAGSHATIEIVEIPDDVEWQVEEYDGMEWVAEKHRTW